MAITTIAKYEEPTEGGAVTTTQDSSFGASSIVSGLKSLSDQLAILINANLLQNEILQNAFDPSAAESRQDLLDSENTDTSPPIATGREGGSFMDSLKGMNPFSGGIGTKTMILLLVGSLFALTKLGPKLVEPLSKFLQWFKEDAMQDITDLWETAKGWWATSWENVTKFFNWMRDDFIPDMQDLWVDAKAWWALQWPKVEKFFTWIQGIFTSIGDYVDKFDIDGDGKLDPEERKALFDEVRKKITDSVGGYIRALTFGILGFMFGPTLLKVAISVGGAMITKAIAGSGAAAAVATAGGSGPGMMSRGASLIAKNAAKLGIAGIVAAGIIGVYTASRNAFAQAATDAEGNVDKTQFASFFISGGDGSGGWKNSVTNGLNKAAIGGAAGVGIAALAGKFAIAGAVGGPMGMLAGGLLGLAIGGIIGVTTGAIGADRMDKAISGVTDGIMEAVDTIGTFYGSFVAGIKGFVTGEGFTDSRNRYLSDKANLTPLTEIDDKQIDVDILRQEYENTKSFSEGGTKGGKEAARKRYQVALNALNHMKRKNEKILETRAEFDEVDKSKAIEMLPAMYKELDALIAANAVIKADTGPGRKATKDAEIHHLRKKIVKQESFLDPTTIENLKKSGFVDTIHPMHQRQDITHLSEKDQNFSSTSADFMVRVKNPNAGITDKNQFMMVDSRTVTNTKLDNYVSGGLVAGNPEVSAELAKAN